MRIAVVIAVYNGERFIEKQLASIYNQSRKADEVIICDDGSSDDSVAIISDFITSHHLETDWKLYRNTTNLGYVQNFYYAISLSSAELIFLSDQDDLWREDKIEKMAAVFSTHPEISLLSCNFGVIDENGQPLHGLMIASSSPSEELESVSTDDILYSYRWPGMTMALRRSFFEETSPYYRQLSVPHDLIFALFAAEKGCFFEYKYCGCDHRRHGNNTAGEEHRVKKLLNLRRKYTEMIHYDRMLSELLAADLPLLKGNEKIKAKHEFHQQRMQSIRHRKLLPLLKLYGSYGTIRWKSLICDVWLICFGNHHNHTQVGDKQ